MPLTWRETATLQIERLQAFYELMPKTPRKNMGDPVLTAELMPSRPRRTLEG